MQTILIARYLGSVGLILASVGAQAAVIDFDENTLAPDSFFDPQANTAWTSGGATFNHGWNDDFNCCWSDFTYSNRTDTTTPGFANDRSAITGDGVGAGQDNYAVGTTGLNNPQLSFGGTTALLGGYFTNATYAYLAMADGDDGNATPFVKGPFGDGDYFKLTITGLDSAGGLLPDSVDIMLANGANVVDSWQWSDLSALGTVYGLEFALSSSDNGTFGMNTPAYFAMDSLSVTAVPLPAGIWLFISAIGAIGIRRKFCN